MSRLRGVRVALLLAAVAFLGGILLWRHQWQRTFAQQRVVAVAHPVPPGEKLTERDLTYLTLPRGGIPAGAVRQPDQALGRWAASHLLPGEPLLAARLTETDPNPSPLTTGRGLLSIPVTPTRVLAGDLQAGDRVDILIAGNPARREPEQPVSAGAQSPPPAHPPPDGAASARGSTTVTATPASRAASAPAAITAGRTTSSRPPLPQGTTAQVLLRDVPVVDVRNAQGFSTQPDPSGRRTGSPVPAAVIVAVPEPQALTLVDALSADRALYLFVTHREEDGP